MCNKNDGRVKEISSDIIYKLFETLSLTRRKKCRLRQIFRGQSFYCSQLKIVLFHVAGKTRKPNTLLFV